MIFVIDDDKVMAGCIAKATQSDCLVFSNAIDAMRKISDNVLPDLIFLDILLDGPDGFTFLNEISSYDDTARVPVVIVSSLDFGGRDLSQYGVVGFLNKDTMLPEEIRRYVKEHI